MSDQYFFDTRMLRDHVLELKDEQRTTLALKNAVQMTKKCGDPSLWSQYDSVLKMIDDLEVYFRRMAVALDEIEWETVEAQRKMELAINEGTEQMKSAGSRFNL